MIVINTRWHRYIHLTFCILAKFAIPKRVSLVLSMAMLQGKSYSKWIEKKGIAFNLIAIPALVLPVSVGVFVTAHSSKPVTPVISAHTSTDSAVSATLVALVTIWIAALPTVQCDIVDKLEGTNLNI